MDSVKDAFRKVREDMGLLREELSTLRRDLQETQEEVLTLCETIQGIQGTQKSLSSEHLLKEELRQLRLSIHSSLAREIQGLVEPLAYLSKQLEEGILSRQTDRRENQADQTHNSTIRQDIRPGNGKNVPISTGNDGVSTDRQTNQQTGGQGQIKGGNHISAVQSTPSPLHSTLDLIGSLGHLKKEIEWQIKRLTNQEWLIFSTIYILEEERGMVDYKTLAERLHLTESSIRDYVGRLIAKGIPIQKKKVNNKQILLSVDDTLKKEAPLPLLVQLRELQK